MYVGKTVRGGETVCYINETENEYVFTAYVADEDITSINVGDRVSMKIPTYDDTENEYLEGTVVNIGDIPLNITERGAVYVVTITPEKIPKNLKPGMEGSVDIIIGSISVTEYFLQSLIF